MSAYTAPTSKRIAKLIPVVIIVLLFSFIRFYHLHSSDKIRIAIIEHSKLLTDPLWNYESTVINSFLSILIARDEYQQIQVFGVDNKLLHETEVKPIVGLDQFLFRLNLLQVKKLSADITKDQDLIGVVTVSWINNSVYYYAYAILVALLLFIIARLYNFVSTANRKLTSYIDDIHQALDELKKQKSYIENVYNVVPAGLITLDKNKDPVDWNPSFNKIVENWAEVLRIDKKDFHNLFLKRLKDAIEDTEKGEYSMEINGNIISLSFESSHITGFKQFDRIISLYDITDTANMRRRLFQSEKLESVGRLAAGIAHEINTPTQYVATNIDFLSGAFEDMSESIEKFGELAKKSPDAASEPDDSSNSTASFSTSYAAILEDMDWEYLESEIPEAIKQSTDGLKRIQSIVSAMKTFSHPSGDTPELHDLNKAIESTITVAKNEWKYIADLDLKLSPDLPTVPCFIDHFNQVILILIINAVHAIEDQLAITGEERGKIVISSQPAEHSVEISITDNGTGMSKEIQKKIFEPFFTTKAVNKGTGQGLAIANDIIVNKQNGAIKIISEQGKGTTFILQMPYSKEEAS